MRPLIIDDSTRAEIERVKAYAESHVFSLDDLLDRNNKELSPPGDHKEWSCLIPVGFKVVFSIEEGLENKKYRHLSVSVDGKPNMLPNVWAVQQFMGEFGFGSNIINGPEIIAGICKVWTEDIDKDHQAINVSELIKQ